MPEIGGVARPSRQGLWVAAAAWLVLASSSAVASDPRQVVNTLAVPTLVTTTLSTTSVYLSWTAVAGATRYDIERRTSNTPFVDLAGYTTGTVGSDVVSPNATYLYRIVASNGTESSVSNVDLATTVAFQDDPLVANVTGLKDYHITQLRTAVNLVRASVGLAQAIWTHPTITALNIRSEEINELRTALDAAVPSAGIGPRVYTDVPLSKDLTLLKKAHIKELRQAVKGVSPSGIYSVTAINASEPYFSPTIDGQKDTTTVTATVSSTDSTWTVYVKNSAGATVRSASGAGGTVSFTWDGRNTSGVIQQDGTYTLAVEAADGPYVASAATSTVLDNTVPTASISSPTSGQSFSNVRLNGNTDVPVTGTTADANFQNWDLAAIRLSSGTAETVATGTSPISNGSLATWKTNSATNGSHDLRLQVRDRAGNVGTATVGVAVAHFGAEQNVFEMNTAGGQTVTYTSVVPFTLTETLTIKNAAGQIVRTLVNMQRVAGTYPDVWNGRNDASVLLPDGVYSYAAVITEGANTLQWDTSTEMRSTSGSTQFPYPTCSKRNFSEQPCSDMANAGQQYDPYTDDPLKIHYTVAQPARVTVVFSPSGETPEVCVPPYVCVIDRAYRASGTHVEEWPAVTEGGVVITVPKYLTVIRGTNNFPKNVVILYGSGASVRLSALSTPALFRPDIGTLKIEFDFASFGSVPAAVTLRMIPQSGGGALRTVTLSGQAPGHVTYNWDGKADSGHWIAPGLYALVISATGSDGRITTVRKPFVVVY